jgi:hypothetical protein
MCKKVVIPNLQHFRYGLIDPHKFTYFSIQVSDVLVLTVRCKFIKLSIRCFLRVFLKCLLVSSLLLYRSSPFISLGSYNHCNSACSFDLIISSILRRTTVYACSIHSNLYSIRLSPYVLSRRSEALLTSTPASSFSEAADLFKISTRFYSSPSILFN